MHAESPLFPGATLTEWLREYFVKPSKGLVMRDGIDWDLLKDTLGSKKAGSSDFF